MITALSNPHSHAKESMPAWIPKWLDMKIRKVEPAGYRIVGPRRHSAVKICHYTRQDIRGEDVCYKCKFYGITSSRCLQMTPVMFWCDFNCSFCWRNLGYTLPPQGFQWDSPDEIIDDAIKAQRELLMGFWGSDASKEKLAKAMEPKHVAISLSGEPCLYPYLPEFIDNLILKRNMTAYLVTNGAHPDMIRKLVAHQPTNLYISVYGPDAETYQKTCSPNIENPFPKVLESLSLMKNFSCRTVMRFTMTKDFNFKEPEAYSKIISMAQPQCVEVKGYMNVGGARARLNAGNMPLHDEIMRFAEAVEKNTDYKIMNQKANSRVVLLQRSGVNVKPEEVMSNDAFV
ncbi:MAG: 4-demethylwyosine synthase TYW1 [Candidatus Aenigmarchaeota archaeon]|nr:4-demethylwyosine synthase TYW1 [Candidatus Aenigmarchaeota archaeon]